METKFDDDDHDTFSYLTSHPEGSTIVKKKLHSVFVFFSPGETNGQKFQNIVFFHKLWGPIHKIPSQVTEPWMREGTRREAKIKQNTRTHSQYKIS